MGLTILAYGYGLNEANGSNDSVAFAWIVQTAYSKTYGHRRPFDLARSTR